MIHGGVGINLNSGKDVQVQKIKDLISLFERYLFAKNRRQGMSIGVGEYCTCVCAKWSEKKKKAEWKCVWTEEPNKRGKTFALALEIRSELSCALKDKHHS
jgi:hypothetical protein